MEEREEQIDNRINLQGEIINKAIVIEKLIDNIIFSFFKPKNETVFISHILNSSIMNYGGKLKVLVAIGEKSNNINIGKSFIEKLRRLSSIRNSFAHTNIDDEYDIHFNNMDDDPFWIIKDSLEVMNASGKVDTKNPNDLFLEFIKIYEEAILILKSINSQLIKTQ